MTPTPPHIWPRPPVGQRAGPREGGARGLVPSRMMSGGREGLPLERSSPGKSAAHWEMEGVECLSLPIWPRGGQKAKTGVRGIGGRGYLGEEQGLEE